MGNGVHDDIEVRSELRAALCPNPECGGLVIDTVMGDFDNSGEGEIHKAERLFPLEVERRLPLDPFIDEKYASLAQEANLIRTRSPRAAAVLLRHCIELMLMDRGHKGGDLNALIDDASKATGEKVVSTILIQHLDLIRTVGKWGAHPKGLSVEPNEVDQLFDSVAIAFDVFILHPKKLADARRSADAKHAAKGMKPIIVRPAPSNDSPLPTSGSDEIPF